MEKLFTKGKGENMEREKKFKLHMPHVLTLIFFLIIVVAVLTWILPSGEFERTIMETSTGERSVAVDGTYHTTEKILEDGTDLRQGISQILMAPGRGIQLAIEVWRLYSLSAAYSRSWRKQMR
jgi:uncharacterized ion transporter superfamily protein YfcC